MPAFSDRDRLDRLTDHAGVELLVGGSGGDPEWQRREGRWFYGDSMALVVGARDKTRGEAADPMVLRRSDGSPQGVLLSLDELKRDSKLAFALTEGQEVSFNGRPHFLLTWAIWEELAAEPVDLVAPELGPPGGKRALARAEGSFRIARQSQDDAATRRTETILAYSALGWTRRRVGDLIEVSATRVQQLIDQAAPELRGRVDALLADAVMLLPALGVPGTELDRDAIAVPDGWDRLKLTRVLDGLVDLDLLVQTKHRVALTHEAHAALIRHAEKVTA
jgi:hypothetical protein